MSVEPSLEDRYLATRAEEISWTAPPKSRAARARWDQEQRLIRDRRQSAAFQVALADYRAPVWPAFPDHDFDCPRCGFIADTVSGCYRTDCVDVELVAAL